MDRELLKTRSLNSPLSNKMIEDLSLGGRGMHAMCALREQCP